MNDRALRTFWAVHCLICHATFGDWDVDTERLAVEEKVACPYCGGAREAHQEAAN